MTIQVGDTIPSAKLTYSDRNGADANACTLPKSTTSSDLFKGKKVVLFAVPGAFTPTCSNDHLPGFVKSYSQLKSKGVDLIGCLSTNDIFVLDAWGKACHADGKVVMLSDGNGEFVSALGLVQDLSKVGFGHTRAQRFALIIDDLKVTYIGVEEGGGVTVSGADAVLSKL